MSPCTIEIGLEHCKSLYRCLLLPLLKLRGSNHCSALMCLCLISVWHRKLKVGKYSVVGIWKQSFSHVACSNWRCLQAWKPGGALLAGRSEGWCVGSKTDGQKGERCACWLKHHPHFSLVQTTFLSWDRTWSIFAFSWLSTGLLLCDQIWVSLVNASSWKKTLFFILTVPDQQIRFHFLIKCWKMSTCKKNQLTILILFDKCIWKRWISDIGASVNVFNAS